MQAHDEKKKSFDAFLEEVLSSKQIEELKNALSEDKTIIVKGIQAPTGKSTLCFLLRKKGYKAFEQHEILELELNKVQECLIPNLDCKI